MDFKAKFNKATVLEFLKNQFLPEDFDESREAIKFSQLSFAPDRLKDIEYIGESPSLGLKLYVMQHDSENDPRVMLSRETFRVMSNLGAQRALVVYHSAGSGNYRLSLATVTLALKGAKTKREYSNPRRYSFFLGPDAKTHTPEQFLSRKVADYNDLLNRFSIEVVNKEFYNEIAIKFTELVGGRRKVKTKVVDFNKPVLRLPGLDMAKPGSHITAQEFAVRLIGRIVFCWFLKKKKSPGGIPLLPESVLSSAAVAACEKEGDNYYHIVLENFFFQVLNTEISERGEEFIKAPYNKIPFLNGGLFEPHDGDFYEFDSLTSCSRHSATLKISNEWFKGLFQTLETYNFTIDENTSVDVELAVDPEMLGRIFENLLAEINPETGETARKSTGSYYTPRPIVEYMVDESLKAFLKNKTAIPVESLADLLSYSESDTELSEPEKEKVIAALDEVKIIDPACGSGAFPMGMLQKIVLVLQKVDPDSQKWLAKLLDSVPDPTARAMLRNKLEGEADLWNYTRKLGVIRKSIYGVDIQPIAVEISKLRFFLSLVVDEKVDDKKKNRAIEPLPNLEFKFVCANTLVGLPAKDLSANIAKSVDVLKAEQEKLGKEYIHKYNSANLNILEQNQLQDRLKAVKKEIEKLSNAKKQPGADSEMYDEARDVDTLKMLRDKYFTASGPGKLKVEYEFISTQNKMLRRSSGWGSPDTIATKLSQWEPFKHKSTGWFDPDWMFGLKDGFDVVIGNPPYVGFHGVDKEYKAKLKELFASASGKFDIYLLFMEKGLHLLQNNGFFTFICPTSFAKRDHGRELRNVLLKNTLINELVDFEHDQMFDQATNYTGVFSFVKSTTATGHKFKYRCGLDDSGSLISQDGLTPDIWIFKDPQSASVIKKIKVGVTLEEIANISEGIVTGLNDLYLRKTDGIKHDNFELEYFVPSFRGREILKYYLKNPSESVFYPYSLEGGHTVPVAEETFKEKSPNFYKYLHANLSKINAREYFKKSSKRWFELWNQRKLQNFLPEKILTPELSDRNRFSLAPKNSFYGDTVCGIVLHEDKLKEITLKYLLAILNSRLMEWFYKSTTVPKAGGFFIYKVMFLKDLPIKIVSRVGQKPFEDLVSKIITIAMSSGYTENAAKQAEASKCMRELDLLVYKLYELTPNEIKVVEAQK